MVMVASAAKPRPCGDMWPGHWPRGDRGADYRHTPAIPGSHIIMARGE